MEMDMEVGTMKLRLDRTKMAMDGNVYAYDLVVPVSEVDRADWRYVVMPMRV
jgi:hypothetical protein